MKKSVCSKCGKIVQQGEGCDKSYCLRGRSGYARKNKKQDPWYNMPIWKGNPNIALGKRGGLREAQLMRQPYCEQCESEGVINDVTSKGRGHVDHKIPFRSAPTKEQQWQLFIDPDNHRTICVSHHMSKTARQS
jgi:hypothetical protein